MNITTIFRRKIIFKLPSKIDSIILDYGTGRFYEKFFKKNAIILKTRGEEFYFKILLLSIFTWIKKKDKTFNQEYIVNCIRIFNPGYLLTFTDYDDFFLSLKKFFPDKKLIVFQSHQRSFPTLKKLIAEKNKRGIDKFDIDLIFIWGDYYKSYYSKFCKSKYFIAGSIKNNMFADKEKIGNRHITLISQFNYNNLRGPGFSFDTNENLKKKILKSLLKFCKLKKIQLNILGRQPSATNIKEEKLYYSKIFGSQNFKFFENQNGFTSYTHSSKLNNFVTFTSSLGLELMSRGKKVCFFKIKRDKYLFSTFKEFIFVIKNKSIWTGKINDKDLFRFFNFLLISNKSSFKKIYNINFKKFIVYDKHNNKLKKHLRKIGIKI